MAKENQEFIKNFEKKVKKTLEKYRLCTKKDRVVVACSGGKDSTTVLYLLKKFGYRVEALHINLLIGDYSKRNLENIRKFCRENKIKLHIINLREELGASICFFRSSIQEKAKMSNCLICGIIKRWLLNKKARELGATKLATGHNLDDGAETFLMNLLKNSLAMDINLGPEGGVIKDKKLVPRIKPLYFCPAKEVRKYSQLKGFPVLYEPCPCAAEVFRRKIRNILNEREKKNPKIKENIIKVFLKLLPVLKEEYKTREKLSYCRVCGEPSRKEVCRACGLMGALTKKSL